ncbi:MAG: hypothetical protein HKN58_00960 [Xanthomonadales bacterium]|nr:hypothetical protein [Xanthomonadales bacterium]
MNRAPARRGFAWLAGSLGLVRAQPARLLLIGLVLQFLTGFSQFGTLGFLFVLAVPALTAGVLQALYLVSLGHRPPLMVLFSAFSIPLRLFRLFVLSMVMIAVGMLAAGALLSGSLAGLDPAIIARLEQGDMSALAGADPAVLQRMMLSLALGVLASGALGFFAIPLVWFSGQSAGAALLNGLAAIFRNVLPLLAMVVGLVILAFPVLVLVSLLLGSGQASPVLTLLVLFVLVAYQLVVFGAQYLAFRELFGAPADPDKADPGDDQLVA